jgi:hypothetical protein
MPSGEPPIKKGSAISQWYQIVTLQGSSTGMDSQPKKPSIHEAGLANKAIMPVSPCKVHV